MLRRLLTPSHSKTDAMLLRRYRKAKKPALAGFPFLRLPRELREMIYDYFREPLGPNFNLTVCPPKTVLWLQDLDGFGLSQEDPIPSQPQPESGIISYYGTVPALALRLTCKQIYHELWQHFCLTRFEVGPLTPHDDEFRFDPTYQKLATSSCLPSLRNLLVRVHVASLKMTTRKHWGTTSYEAIGLEDCVLKLQTLAEMLVRVLRKRGECVRSITVAWRDDFPDGDWGLKASVLFPFGTLQGVQLKLGELVVQEGARGTLKKMLDQTLEGLSAVE